MAVQPLTAPFISIDGLRNLRSSVLSDTTFPRNSRTAYNLIIKFNNYFLNNQYDEPDIDCMIARCTFWLGRKICIFWSDAIFAFFGRTAKFAFFGRAAKFAFFNFAIMRHWTQVCIFCRTAKFAFFSRAAKFALFNFAIMRHWTQVSCVTGHKYLQFLFLKSCVTGHKFSSRLKLQRIARMRP